VLEKLNTKIGIIIKVSNIEKLNDGLWEICILKSHRYTIKDRLREIFLNSNVELYHNSLKPIANDLEI
jgi:hypothetical protein